MSSQLNALIVDARQRELASAARARRAVLLSELRAERAGQDRRPLRHATARLRPAAVISALTARRVTA